MKLIVRVSGVGVFTPESWPVFAKSSEPSISIMMSARLLFDEFGVLEKASSHDFLKSWELSWSPLENFFWVFIWKFRVLKSLLNVKDLAASGRTRPLPPLCTRDSKTFSIIASSTRVCWDEGCSGVTHWWG